MLEDSNAFIAKALEREHERDRIRPAHVRPVIDRPLAWWEEPPVVYVKSKQRRWW